jgi:hypothetical protein
LSSARMGSGHVLTSQTNGRARKKSTKGVVPVVVLFAQVGRGTAGELVGGTGDGWEEGDRSARYAPKHAYGSKHVPKVATSPPCLVNVVHGPTFVFASEFLAAAKRRPMPPNTAPW